MTEIDSTITQIADIRAQLASTTRFRGYAPEVVALVAMTWLLLLLIQTNRAATLGSNDREIVVEWGMLIGAGGLLIAIEAVSRTLRATDRLARLLLLGAMRLVLPGCLMAALVPTAVLMYAPSTAWVIPGLWQMLIGFVAIASYASLPRQIIWPALWFLLSGAVTLFVAGAHGAISPFAAGLPFVVGHLGIAWALWERGGQANDR
jgi:hypothetical protein